MEQTLLTAGSILFVIFIWEHVARKNSVSFRPSSIINYIADQFVAVFYWIGNKFAWLSSFYDWIEFGELIHTAQVLWRAVWLLVTTPLELIKGYYDYLKTLSYPALGVLGTVTLLVLPLVVLGPPSFVYSFWSGIWMQVNETDIQMGLLAICVFAGILTLLKVANFLREGEEAWLKRLSVPPQPKPKRSRATPTTPRRALASDDDQLLHQMRNGPL